MTFIIADAGVNFRNLDEAATIIDQAAKAGVDAVKFWAFTTRGILLHDRWQELMEIVLLENEIKYLVSVCKHNHVEFMCTPMYRDAVKILRPYVKQWSIRYKDRNDVHLFQETYTDPRPTLVSCSGRHDTIWLKSHRRRKNVVLMFRVPGLPPTEVNLPKNFNGMGGFSSRYPDGVVPVEAARRGADFIEVRVMLDQYTNQWVPIDAPVSLTMTDLTKVVKEIRHLDRSPPVI